MSPTGNIRTTADTPEEIADTFNNYFISVFSVPHEDKVDNGAGKFPARILKETATTIAPSLCMLFNSSLGEGYIPSEWKLANGVPVYKKDEKDHVENYGFGGNLLTWFRAYLCGRRQRVSVLGATSRDLPVTSGVPQGSILGPALLLYVSNLRDSILNSKVAMFAPFE